MLRSAITPDDVWHMSLMLLIILFEGCQIVSIFLMFIDPNSKIDLPDVIGGAKGSGIWQYMGNQVMTIVASNVTNIRILWKANAPWIHPPQLLSHCL